MNDYNYEIKAAIDFLTRQEIHKPMAVDEQEKVIQNLVKIIDLQGQDIKRLNKTIKIIESMTTNTCTYIEGEKIK